LHAPALDPTIPAGPVEARYALPDQSVLPERSQRVLRQARPDPDLALTSFAATTPQHWRVAYWDENLLDGPPPFQPMPEVVAITVHLTFARRAFELARWYASAARKVILGDCTFFRVRTSARRTRMRSRWATACSSGRGF